MQVEADIRNPLEVGDWDDSLLLSSGGCSFFHSAAWARVLHATYRFTPMYFTVPRGSGFAVMLPVMDVCSVLTGRRGVSLPFTDFCDPMAVDGGALSAVVQAVIAHGSGLKWGHVEFRSEKCLPAGAPRSMRYIGHTLTLSPDESMLSEGLDAGFRRALRKAANAGVDVCLSDSLDAMRAFCRLHWKTRKRHGLPPQPFGFFRSIHEYVIRGGKGVVVLASHRGTPMAGAVFFRFGRQAIFKFGASDKRYQGLRGGNLVLWEGIRWAARGGCSELSLGRTDPENEGLRRYKRGCGAHEYPIAYARYDLGKHGFVGATARVRGWHHPAFRRIPVWLSRAVGWALYRHMA